ncbi:MAG TPA: T9SS type A sorting domain-containing protein [Flavobacteriales bacterium]|nr:T9SS type A sorting domain-containing protein [Flavobacteriales bacterium]
MKKGLVSLIFLSLSINLFAQSTVEQVYGTSWCYEEATSITAVSNQRYLVAGNYICGGGSYERKSYLLLLDKNLDTVWTKRDLALNGLVRKTSDDQFIYIGGNDVSYNYDSVVVTKTTLNGTELWSKQFGFSSCNCNAWDAMETADGGFVITGTYTTGNCALPRIQSFILKLDDWGNEIWRTDITGSGFDQMFQVKETPTGGLGVFGWTTSQGAGSHDQYLIKLDAAGNILWQQTYGDTLSNYGYGMQPARDGGFLLLGYTFDIELIKVDSLGAVEWTKNYGSACGGRNFKIVEIEEGYVLLVNEFNGTDCGSALMQIDVKGNVYWRKSFGGSLRDLQQTENGIYLAAGYRDYFPDIYVVKFDTLRPADPHYQNYGDSIFSPQTSDGNIFSLLPPPPIEDTSDVETYINSLNLDSKYNIINVYPNPAMNYINFEFDNPKGTAFTFELFDLSGKKVRDRHDIEGEYFRLECGNLPVGYYSYILKNGKGIYLAGKISFQ